MPFQRRFSLDKKTNVSKLKQINEKRRHFFKNFEINFYKGGFYMKIKVRYEKDKNIHEKFEEYLKYHDALKATK